MHIHFLFMGPSEYEAAAYENMRSSMRGLLCEYVRPPALSIQNTTTNNMSRDSFVFRCGDLPLISVCMPLSKSF